MGSSRRDSRFHLEPGEHRLRLSYSGFLSSKELVVSAGANLSGEGTTVPTDQAIGLHGIPWKHLIPVVPKASVASIDDRFRVYRSACLMNLSYWVGDSSAAWVLVRCSSPVRVCSVHRRTEILP